jgi:hypothetical protein
VLVGALRAVAAGESALGATIVKVSSQHSSLHTRPELMCRALLARCKGCRAQEQGDAQSSRGQVGPVGTAAPPRRLLTPRGREETRVILEMHSPFVFPVTVSDMRVVCQVRNGPNGFRMGSALGMCVL